MQEHDSVQLLVGCMMRSKYDRLTVRPAQQRGNYFYLNLIGDLLRNL